MMPQREAGSPIDEQAGSTYGNYEGNQADAYQQFETSYQQPLQEERAAKVYARGHGNKNMLRLTAFVITMLMLIVLAVFCLVITGGTGGWISFCVASLIVFILAVVVIDKLE